MKSNKTSVFSPVSELSTVQEARAFVKSQDDTVCPVCTSRIKTYTRNLPRADLGALVSLYYLTTQQEKGTGQVCSEFFHIAELQGKSGGGDFAKFRFWGLIESKPNADDPSKKDSGLWRITPKGREFVENTRRLPKKVFVRLGEYQGVATTDEVNLEEANEECYFDFQELMNS